MALLLNLRSLSLFILGWAPSLVNAFYIALEQNERDFRFNLKQKENKRFLLLLFNPLLQNVL